MDGWNTTFILGPGLFSGAMLLSGRVHFKVYILGTFFVYSSREFAESMLLSLKVHRWRHHLFLLFSTTVLALVSRMTPDIVIYCNRLLKENTRIRPGKWPHSSPENTPLEKDKHLQFDSIFWVLCLFSGVYVGWILSSWKVLGSLAVRARDRCDLAEWPKTTMWKGGREEAKMLERCHKTKLSIRRFLSPTNRSLLHQYRSSRWEMMRNATESKHVETMIRFDRQSFNVVPPKWFGFIWLLVDWVCFCWGGPKTINLTFSPMKSWGTPTPIPLKHPESRVRPPLFGYPYNVYSMLSTYVQYPK